VVEVVCYQDGNFVWGHAIQAAWPVGSGTIYPYYGNWDPSRPSVCVVSFMVWTRSYGALWRSVVLDSVDILLQP
jgi:hypothetical protein